MRPGGGALHRHVVWQVRGLRHVDRRGPGVERRRRFLGRRKVEQGGNRHFQRAGDLCKRVVARRRTGPLEELAHVGLVQPGAQARLLFRQAEFVHAPADAPVQCIVCFHQGIIVPRKTVLKGD